MGRDWFGIELWQRDGRSYLVFGFPLFGMEPDRRLLSGLAAIKGMGRRGAMGFGLRDLGAAWLCRGALAANASAHLHCSVAVASFGSLSRALSGKTAEIRRLWVARCRVSILVSTIRTNRRHGTRDVRAWTEKHVTEQPSDGRVMLKGAERSQPIATVKTIDPSATRRSRQNSALP